SFRPPTGSAGLDDQDFVYPEPLTNGWEAYVREPREFAAYVQDKIELDDFIINLGLRFDYFDPNAQTLSDLLNPNYNELFPFGNKQAETNFQLSPRLGVAFPISSTGVIHVSYGHFFQIPNFEQLYQMSADHPDGTVRYPIDQEGLNTVIGNPELDAQRTVTYELGLQQGLTDDIALDFTAYYRDIRNLVGTQIIGTYDANRYARFINLDYGNTRGVVLSFEKRHTDFWGGRIDYTYQIAEGNASDPRSAFFDSQGDPPTEPEKQLIPLDWDQRSTLNSSLTIGKPGNWNASLIGRLGTGTPYTAEIKWTGVNVNFRNNRIKPNRFTLDMKAEKTLKLLGAQATAFVWVENLLDNRNELGVYGSSGRATYDLNTRDAGTIIALHSIGEYINNPQLYNAPRQVRFGLTLGF
nr:TonB-dependent receptor [Calditrichia bacterium]